MDDLLKTGYAGGEELRRAMATLAGPSSSKEDSEGEDGAPVPQPVPLPIHLSDTADHTVRELAFAAQRYGKAAQRDPQDFEAVYNHGLALQELALRSGNSRNEQQKLLTQAADCYEAAWRMRATSHAALYNWGVALSDMARVVKSADKEGARQCLEEAAEKYAMSLAWNPNNPQALNNWGLVLQELSQMGAPAEQSYLVRQSIIKFQRAIRLRPDFDRACYNLGTVYYAHACTQQSALTQQLPSRLTQDPAHEQAERENGATVRRTFGLAAQYIILAHALQPSKEVYQKSLHVIQPLLPLPHLRAGFLTAADPATAHSCNERWEQSWFVIDQESFRSSQGDSAPQQVEEAAEVLSNPQAQIRIQLLDITAARVCLDPSLPSGHAFWLGLEGHPSGVYFVAENEDDAEGWVDALLLCAHLAAVKQLQALRQALNPPANKQPPPLRKQESARR